MALAELPPGPRLPRLAQAALLAWEPYAWMRARHRRYGDVWRSHFPVFGRIVYLADPDDVKRLFSGDPTLMHAGEANASVLGDPLGRHSLLTLDEDAHMSQRKLLLPPFHGDSVRRYVETMAEATAAEVATWPVGRPFALRPRMQQITLEVILRAVFGVREEERLDRFREAIPQLAEATSVLAWLPLLDRDFGPRSPAGRFKRALAAADELVYEEIGRRRAEGGQGDDVLSLLLAARHDDGSPMSDVELRDELMTLLTAGHETTATGLSWAFERLTRTPVVLERLAADLDDDAYLDAVVRETLRARPVVLDVARLLTRETEIAGYALPAGTIVLAAIGAMHSRPEAYPDWEAFRPERFLDDGPPPYSWIPFGGGVRRCIGAAFAQVEMRTVLREVLRRVRLAPDRARPERPRVAHVTVVPARGARVVVSERLAEPAAAAAEPATALA